MSKRSNFFPFSIVPSLLGGWVEKMQAMVEKIFLPAKKAAKSVLDVGSRGWMINGLNTDKDFYKLHFLAVLTYLFWNTGSVKMMILSNKTFSWYILAG